MDIIISENIVYIVLLVFGILQGVRAMDDNVTERKLRARDMSHLSDRLRVTYTASVPNDVRSGIVAAIEKIANDSGLFTYAHYDNSMGAWSVDVTPYDRTAKHPVSDGQVIDLLKSIAEEKGISISALLQVAKDI